MPKKLENKKSAAVALGVKVAPEFARAVHVARAKTGMSLKFAITQALRAYFSLEVDA